MEGISSAVVVLAGLLACGPFGCDSLPSENCDSGEVPLFLSPYIADGQTEHAKTLARVTCLPGGSDVTSYSGYITVDKPECGSHLFFWFFPAQENPDSAPVILWLNGGPYISSMIGALMQHGPLQLRTSQTGQLHVTAREMTWAREFSMLYVDNPVGTGASYTSGGCYSRNMEDTSGNLYSFLQQFFAVFTEHSSNDFYLGGQSYAGKYVPSLGHLIHQQNQECPPTFINLQGIFLGGGLCDPETMLPEFAEYMFSVGICTEVTRRKIKEQLSVEHWSKVLEESRFHPQVSFAETGMGQVAQYLDLYDLRKAEVGSQGVSDEKLLYLFMSLPDVATALHYLPENVAKERDILRYSHYNQDFLNSTKPQMAFLMDRYKVLYYTGNMDVIVNVRMGEAFLLSTPWSGQAAYSNMDHTPWTLDGQLVGYRTTVRNFTRVVIRNAGHNVPADQPKVALAMIKDFIQPPHGQ